MDLEFNKREDINKLKLSETKKILSKIKLGGGEKELQKQKKEVKQFPTEEEIDKLINDIIKE